MIGKQKVIDLEHDSYELLFVIEDYLKKNGISYSNKIEGNKLQGYGDAGMGIFIIEKIQDRYKNIKLYVDTNSGMSEEILISLIDMAIEHVTENDLWDKEEIELDKNASLEAKGEIEAVAEKKDCKHDFHLMKEEEFMGMEISVFHCKNCNKLELYKK